MKIVKCLKFAAEKHKNQERRCSGLPYIIHPITVMHLLEKYKVSKNKDYKHNAKAGLENGENKKNKEGGLQSLYNKEGRYPSQLFINEDMAEVLDNQSGILKSGARKSSYIRKGKNPNETYGKFNEISMDDAEADSGGLSRFFHQIGYLDEEFRKK